MKVIFLVIAVYAFCWFPFFELKAAENPSRQTKVRKQLEKAASEFQKALAERNFEKLIDLMALPASSDTDESVSDIERREKEIAVVKQLFEEASQSGVDFKTKLGQPKTIENINGELFSVIPQYTIVKVNKNSSSGGNLNNNISAGEYKATSYFVAISKDKGRNWKFWDGLLIDSFKETFPEAGKRIRFPKIQKPAFLNKND